MLIVKSPTLVGSFGILLIVLTHKSPFHIIGDLFFRLFLISYTFSLYLFGLCREYSPCQYCPTFHSVKTKESKTE